MADYNEKEEKKGGFWASLSGLLRGGSSVGGGASGLGSAGGASGLGSSGGLAGLFATKAGIVGLVLGGATIAAGVGVVYNFVGAGSKPVYSPELFQNTYYEEEASKAGQERSRARDASAAGVSTLDMFKEQAKKDGLGGLNSEGESGDGASAAAEAPAGAPSADGAAPAAPGADGAAGGGGAPKMLPASGFGGKSGSGGSSSVIPRMQAGAGLSGGIGAQFQPVYRPPAGKTSGMTTASAAKVSKSPKYAVPNFSKKGAFGQAKYAGKLGAQASYSADMAGARTSATSAFTGETSGGGDVGAPTSGAGLGGAGVSNGASLKGNDPSLNSNETTIPKVTDPEDVDPWQKYEEDAKNSMLYAGALILLTMALSWAAQKAMAATPAMTALAVALYWAAVATAAAAIAFALKVMYSGYMMMSKYGQKMMGGVYLVVGAVLIWKAYVALMSAYGGATGAAGGGAAAGGSSSATSVPGGFNPVG